MTQIAGEQVYKQQIVKKNAFLHNLAIIPVYNIDSDTMYSEIIPMSIEKMVQSKDSNQCFYRIEEGNDFSSLQNQ